MLITSLKERLKDACHLDELAIFTGDTLSKGDEELFFLFAFLASAFSLGHLFIEVTENGTLPSIDLVFQPKKGHDEPLTQDELQMLAHAIIDGFNKCPSHELIVKEGSRLYFQKSYYLERQILAEYTRLKNGRPLVEVDRELFQNEVKGALLQNRLLPKQAEAILYAELKPISLIFGGPGTGKTYTAAKFLEFFLKSIPQDDSLLRIAITGPTGKATANLEKSIKRSLGAEYFAKIQHFVEAKTLHKLLNKGHKRQDKNLNILPYQLIFVDEASMLDIHLAHELLSRLQTGTRLIFLGDPNQLPAIEAGDLFRELVEREEKLFYPDEAKGKLSHSMRTELKEILELAGFVNEGSSEKAFHFLKNETTAVRFQQIQETAEFFRKTLDEVFSEFKTIFAQPDVEAILRASTKLRILSPLNDGVFGSHEMNAYLLSEAKKQGKEFPFVPIIISKNDYTLSLMNGEMGILNSFEEMAYFEDKDGAIRKIPACLLSHYEVAFCLSIHKSQGSEFDKVYLFFPSGSEFFGRKCLYTAITRARKEIEIFSDLNTLKQAIELEGKRLQSIFPLSYNK